MQRLRNKKAERIEYMKRWLVVRTCDIVSCALCVSIDNCLFCLKEAVGEPWHVSPQFESFNCLVTE